MSTSRSIRPYFLTGAIINCLGDSTTWGDDGCGGGGPTRSWTAHLSALTGAELVRNYGSKGSCVAITDNRDDSFVERFEQMESRADLIVVFGGVNDFCRSVPIGSCGDEDPRTFSGALDTLVRGLTRIAPEAHLMFMTPCKTAGIPLKHLPSSFKVNSLGSVQVDYVAAMRVACDRYAVPVIDLFSSSGISPFLPEHRRLFMPDGLHYTEAGYKRLAQRIAAGLRAVENRRLAPFGSSGPGA